jgi:hypothetical protein
VALKPAQPKIDAKKPLDQKPVVETRPGDAKPIEGKPVEVKPGEVAGGTPAPVVDGGASVDGEDKKKPDWNRFSSVAMSKIPVSTPMRGSVLNARIDVLKKPKPAPVAEESDE